MIVASEFLEYLSIFNVPYGPRANPTAFTCYAASTANLTGYVYYNGPANDGIGATLTAPSNGAFVVDGKTPALDAKILYKNDTTGSGAYNGIYTLTTVGNGSTPAVLTRSSTYNTPAAINNGGIIPIITGTVNGGTAWFNTSAVVTIGVTPIVYQEFSPFQGILSPAQGGTGVNNGTNTLTLSGNTSFVGGHTFTGTLTANTNVTFPVAGTLVSQVQVQTSAFNSGVSSGSLDSYTVALNPAVASLTDGLIIAMTANHTNSGTTPTLTVNSLAPVNIVLWSGNVIPGDIENGYTYLFVYNGVSGEFELINPSISSANTMLVQGSAYNLAADTGIASNTYVANLTPAPLVPNQAGVFVYLEVANTNTGASTLTLNGVTSPIVTNGNAALTGGEMLANGISLLFFSSTYNAYVLINSALQVVIPKNGASRYVVDAGGRGEYTTIQAGIDAALANTPTATTPGLVYVWAGTYTENLTLHDYVYLVAAGYGAVNVVGTMTYAGTGAFYMQKIFANQTGGPATFVASGTGKPTLSGCNLTNTGGTCFVGSAVSSPLLIDTELTANAGAKQFDLSGGCIVGWTNALGNYTDTASTLNNAGLVIENGSLGGAFVLVSSVLEMANTGGSVFSENLAFCAMDVSSVFTAQNCQIYSDSPSAAVVTGPGVFVADMVSLTGSNQSIDPLVQIQGHVNYLGYIARANTFVPGFVAVVTGSTGGITAINPVLASYYEFTGTTNQIAVLPNANFCYQAQEYTFDNQSTGIITVQNNGGTTLFTMQPYTKVVITLYSNVGSNGIWMWNWAINQQSGGYNPVANYVVSSIPGQAQYQTVQSAINAALAASPSSSAPALIWVFGGNYTENLTLYPWIDLAAASDPSTAGVNVIGNAVYAGAGNISLSNIGFTTNNTNAALSFQSSGSADVHLQSVAIDAASGKGLECTSGTTTINGSIGSISAATGGKCFNITAGFVEILASSTSYTDTASTISGGEFRVFSCDLADAYNVTGGIAEFVGGTYVNSGSLPCFNIGPSGTVYTQDVICNSSSGTDNFVTGTGTFIYSNVSAVGGAQGIDPGLTLNGQPQYTGTQNVLGFVNATTGNGNGSLNWVPQTNTVGDFICQVSNATNIAQSQICTIPDVGPSGAAQFIMSSSASDTQNIAGALTVGGNPLVTEIDGTFSPQLQFGGANVGMTGSYQGVYSRVGNTVTFAITITLSNKGSSTGSATVTGLPVAGRSAVINQNFYAAGNGLTFTSFPIGALAGATTYLGLYDVISGTGGLPLDDTNFSNTTQLFVSGTYLV